MLIAALLSVSTLAFASGRRTYSSSSTYSRTYSGTSHRSYGTPRSYPRSRSYSPRSYGRSSSSSSGIARDSRGRIMRSTSAKNDFKRQRPCPSTGRSSGACPGYVFDHVKPLECGGADAPSNMQWQTIAAGKAKDKTERTCRY